MGLSYFCGRGRGGGPAGAAVHHGRGTAAAGGFLRKKLTFLPFWPFWQFFDVFAVLDRFGPFSDVFVSFFDVLNRFGRRFDLGIDPRGQVYEGPGIGNHR